MPEPATCRWCGQEFPSRNQVFKHVRDTAACARAAAEEDARATAVLAEGARPKVHAAAFVVWGAWEDASAETGLARARLVLARALAMAGARSVSTLASAHPIVIAAATGQDPRCAVLVACFQCSCAEHSAFCGQDLLHRTHTTFSHADVRPQDAAEQLLVSFATIVPPSCKYSSVEDLAVQDLSHLLPLDQGLPPYEPPAKISQHDLPHLITVVVTTSPMRSDPDLDLLSTTFGSLSLAGLQSCRKILVCDRLETDTSAPEQAAAQPPAHSAEQAAAHEPDICQREGAEQKFRGFKKGSLPSAYLRRYSERLAALRQAVWVRDMKIEILELDSWHGFALATRRALDSVATPLVCVIQHDLVNI
jgi:hypothetical protein